MEQPRFSGVALPPLSHSQGEGKYAEPDMDGVGKNNAEEFSYTQPTKDGYEDDQHEDQEKSSQALQDPILQKVLHVLQQLGISVHLEGHRLKHERQRDAGASNSSPGVYCKNLLLKDKKGQGYLIICDENDSADLQVVRFHLNCSGNLHFASRESLWNLLRVKPGAVTPLALIHPSAQGVRVLIDASLVKRIDRDATQLFFHPLLPELQVGLTLTQLEMFLHHCGVTLETLPSLVSYSLRRKYNFSNVGSRYKHRNHQENQDLLKSGEPKIDKATEARKQASTLHMTIQEHQPENSEESLSQYENLFQQLGMKVDIILSNGQGPFVPCRCVYLKDKRDSYFLFICHELQKVDFSNLKTQLKPRKKITPLDKEELQSLLNLTEGHENPFPLASVTQPRFLVAIADNLYQKNKATLTFPHPMNSSLRLKVTLKDLEAFFQGVDHDLTTIPVKGTLESLLESSTLEACSSSSTSTTATIKHPETEEKDDLGLKLTHEFVQSPDLNSTSSAATFPQKQNLFYQMTAPLRDWVMRWIRWIVRLLDRYLPCCISARLQQSAHWQHMLSPALDVVTENSGQQLNEKEESRKREHHAKVTKLRQLIEESGISVEMKTMPNSASSENDDAERCRICLLQSAMGRPYFMLCSQDEDPDRLKLRQLRTAFRCRGALKPAMDADISQLLSWKEGETTVSWTEEELNPLALLQLDLSSLGRVRVGVRADIYSFPDTTITCHLPSLGVALTMNYDDLERSLKRQGFCIVYLP